MSTSPPSPSSSTEAPCRSARTASPEAPVTPSPPPPKGRHAFAAFKNNVLNINPTAYMWVKNSSGYSRLCHKCSPSSEPVQAHLWIVGSLERHTLDSATKSFNAWTVTLRLSQECNRSLDALLKTGPLKSYDPPNRYSVLKIKASFDSVQEGDDDEEFLSTTSPFPFMYEGSCLVEGQSRVPEPCDVSMFSARPWSRLKSPSSGTRGWETGILLTPLEYAAFITSASFLRRPRRLRGNGKGLCT